MSSLVNALRPLSLADIVTAGSGLTSRCIIHGAEGAGKTSLGAAAPKPIVLMTRGETGLLTLTHKWADLVLFLHFVSHVEARRGEAKGKAYGGSRRMLFTTRMAAWDAKNRHGLPESIDAGASATQAWTNLTTAMRASKPVEVTVAADSQRDVSLVTLSNCTFPKNLGLLTRQFPTLVGKRRPSWHDSGITERCRTQESHGWQSGNCRPRSPPGSNA